MCSAHKNKTGNRPISASQYTGKKKCNIYDQKAHRICTIPMFHIL